MFCYRCGAQLEGTEKFCGHCGAPLEQAMKSMAREQTPPPPEQTPPAAEQPAPESAPVEEPAGAEASIPTAEPAADGGGPAAPPPPEGPEFVPGPDGPEDGQPTAPKGGKKKWLLPVIIAAALAVGIGVRAVTAADDFSTFRFTLLPLGVCTPLLFILAVLIPCPCFLNLEKQSVVERLRME